MKKEILVAISVAGVLFGLSVSLAAQEKLSLAQCREMALKYNKDMAAANKQTEAARLMSLSYKANFFPNFTVNEPNMASGNNGIIPKIVVSEAIITGRRRLCELSINAVTGSTP